MLPLTCNGWVLLQRPQGLHHADYFSSFLWPQVATTDLMTVLMLTVLGTPFNSAESTLRMVLRADAEGG